MIEYIAIHAIAFVFLVFAVIVLIMVVSHD